MEHEAINLLLQDFGKTLGIECLSFDDKGCCCLMFDDIIVNLESTPDTDQLFVYSNLGRISKSRASELYVELLEDNFFFRGTGGATLGLDRNHDCVVLAYQFQCQNLYLQRFSQVMENFVNIAALWIQKLVASEHRQDVVTAPPNAAASWQRA